LAFSNAVTDFFWDGAREPNNMSDWQK